MKLKDVELFVLSRSFFNHKTIMIWSSKSVMKFCKMFHFYGKSRTPYIWIKSVQALTVWVFKKIDIWKYYNVSYKTFGNFSNLHCNCLKRVKLCVLFHPQAVSHANYEIYFLSRSQFPNNKDRPSPYSQEVPYTYTFSSSVLKIRSPSCPQESFSPVSERALLGAGDGLGKE